MTDKPRVVVLGAGPAGMSAAWRLSELGYPVTVLERDGTVGGMAKSITLGDFRVDYGRAARCWRPSSPSSARIRWC
jgi:UDP-galactopyranose mutase